MDGSVYVHDTAASITYTEGKSVSVGSNDNWNEHLLLETDFLLYPAY